VISYSMGIVAIRKTIAEFKIIRQGDEDLLLAIQT
jgi:hypothetical protein